MTEGAGTVGFVVGVVVGLAAVAEGAHSYMQITDIQSHDSNEYILALCKLC